MANAERPEVLAFELLAFRFVELATVLGKYDVAGAHEFLDQTDRTLQETIAAIRSRLPNELNEGLANDALLNVSNLIESVVERARDAVQQKVH